ncbi:hypothetical protein [Bacillus thuringiensis]|uniref:hypothetical protein n=1 Tax=Bacillus thuringiensis TaxID=1428 RepID=UPI0021D69102|nr:hypothetical protein [Bacillus thuringiensis]MCU7667563.1 hypothetical protein [Bacillus thuringiensis]
MKDNPTLVLTAPPGDKLCFDTSIIPTGLFYMGKMDKEQIRMMKGDIPVSFRLLTFLLVRNQHVFEVSSLLEELKGEKDLGEVSQLIPHVFEYDLDDVIVNIKQYLEELIEEGYLDYLYLRGH